LTGLQSSNVSRFTFTISMPLSHGKHPGMTRTVDLDPEDARAHLDQKQKQETAQVEEIQAVTLSIL